MFKYDGDEAYGMAKECCPTTNVCPPNCCDMRGMLSFLVLWLLNKRDMYGDEIARELGKMKGEKPTPGTIYPALKQLKHRGAIESKKEGRRVVYSLTKRGEKGLKEAMEYFFSVFGDVIEDYKKLGLAAK